MKGILLLNGEPYSGEIDAKDAAVVCCDGAYRWAKGKLPIDENVGDFDSLDETPSPLPERVYPAEKDWTDGELAIRKLIQKGCREIDIYGGGGGREDHFLGNLHLLYYAHQRGVQAKLWTERSVIYPVSGEVELNGLKGRTVSLLPFGERAQIERGEGFYYPLQDITLCYGSCRGISNVIVQERARFTVTKGRALVIVNRKPVD